MADSTSSPTIETPKATSAANPPVQDIQKKVEPEPDQSLQMEQRIMKSVGGGNPETPPDRFAGALGRVPSSSQAGMLRQLQRSYGNQYVGQVIQAKLEVGSPDDIYEREADQVAEQIMRMPGSTAWKITHPDPAPAVQRMCSACEDEVQRQPQEKKEKEDKEEMMQMRAIAGSITPLVQRQTEAERTEDDESEERTIQPKENSGQAPSVTPTLEARLNMSKGSGQPLPLQTRSFMEPRFGYDFSQIRVHTDGEADQLNRELGAQAFTHTRDVYFGAGKYSPESGEGKRLLAHELTHVVQQVGQVQTQGLSQRQTSTEIVQRNGVNPYVPFFMEDFENLNISGSNNSLTGNADIPAHGITGPLPTGTHISGEDWVLDQFSEDEMVLEVGRSMLLILSDENEHYGYCIEPRTTPMQQVVRVVSTPGVVINTIISADEPVSLVVHTREVTSPGLATTQLEWGVMEIIRGKGRQFNLDHSSVSISVPEESPNGFLKGEFPDAYYAYYLVPEWTGEDNKEKEIHIVATPGVVIESWEEDPLTELGGDFAIPLIASGYGRRLIPRIVRVQNPILIPPQGTAFRAEDFLTYQNYRPAYLPPIGGENMESIDVYTGSSGVTIQHPYTNTTLSIRPKDPSFGASFAYQVVPPTDENLGEIRVIVGPEVIVELIEEEPSIGDDYDRLITENPSDWDDSPYYQGEALERQGRTRFELIEVFQSKDVPLQGSLIDIEYYRNSEIGFYREPDKHRYIPSPENEFERNLFNTNTIALDIGIGAIPIIGDIVEIGEFALALITDKDKWGRKVNTTDKIVMGLGALIGLIPFVGGVGSAARQGSKAVLKLAHVATQMGKSVERLEVILGNLKRVVSKSEEVVIRRAERGLREGGEVAVEDVKRILRLTDELGAEALSRAQMSGLGIDWRLKGYDPLGDLKIKGHATIPEDEISNFARGVDELPDGHELKYLNDGRVFLCSSYCTNVTEFAKTYSAILKKDSDLQRELAKIAEISDETQRLSRLNNLEEQIKNKKIQEIFEESGARVQGIKTLDDVSKFRRDVLDTPPTSVRTDADQLDWIDYKFYAEQRMRKIEKALQEGKTPPNPPRTFNSFRQTYPIGHVVRNNISGTRFEVRTADVLTEVLGEEAAGRWMKQANMSETLSPSRAPGELTRADFLTGRADGSGLSAISNKSRQSFIGMSKDAVRSQVIKDIEEAVDKYTGLRSIRRAEGQTEEVTRVWLLYDAAKIPESLRPIIRGTVSDYQRLYPVNQLKLEVGIF